MLHCIINHYFTCIICHCKMSTNVLKARCSKNVSLQNIKFSFRGMFDTSLSQTITSQKLFCFKCYMTKTILDHILCTSFFRYTGLQIIFQNLLNIMSGKNKIPSDNYENLSDINFYKCF